MNKDFSRNLSLKKFLTSRVESSFVFSRYFLSALAVFFVSTSFVFAQTVPVLSNPVSVYVRPSVSCAPKSGSYIVGDLATWTSSVKPVGTYTYVWKSTGNLTTDPVTNSSYIRTYSSIGNYTASVTVTPVFSPAEPAMQDQLKQTVNCISGVNINAQPKPNLTPLGAAGATPGPNKPVAILGVSALNRYTIGSTVTFRIQPKNIGTLATAGSFRNILQKKPYNSTSPFVTVSQVDINTSLGTGVSVDAQVSYTTTAADNSVSGYEFRYCVDLPQTLSPANATITGNINELNENDNCSSSELIKPLAVSGTLSCLQDSVTPTSKINLSWSQIGGTNVSIFRKNMTSRTEALVSAVFGASGNVADSPLSPNTTYTYTLRNGNTVTSPSIITATCSTPPVIVQKPDLTPSGAAGAGSGVNRPVPVSTNPPYIKGAAQTVTFNVEPKNIGTVSAGSFKVTLQKKPHDDLAYPLVINGSTASISGLEPQKSKIAQMSDSFTGQTTNGYDFRYCIDVPGVVDESNENNNCSGDYWFRPPTGSLYVTLTPKNQTITKGQSTGLNWDSNGASCASPGTSLQVGFAVPTAGSEGNISGGTSVTPPQTVGTYTYGITCSKPGFTSVSDTARITVVEPPGQLSVSCTRSSPSGSVVTGLPQQIAWWARISGGVAPYSYAFQRDDTDPLSFATLSSAGGVGVNLRYNTAGSKSAYVTVKDSAVITNSLKVQCAPSLLINNPVGDFSIGATSPVSMKFVGQGANSAPINVFVSAIAGFTDDVLVSAQSDPLPPFKGTELVPVNFEFYSDSALKSPMNLAAIRQPDGGYAKGLYMVIKANKQIKAGSYIVNITGRSASSDTERSANTTVQVQVINPIFEEI